MAADELPAQACVTCTDLPPRPERLSCGIMLAMVAAVPRRRTCLKQPALKKICRADATSAWLCASRPALRRSWAAAMTVFLLDCTNGSLLQPEVPRVAYICVTRTQAARRAAPRTQRASHERPPAEQNAPIQQPQALQAGFKAATVAHTNTDHPAPHTHQLHPHPHVASMDSLSANQA